MVVDVLPEVLGRHGDLRSAADSVGTSPPIMTVFLSNPMIVMEVIKVLQNQSILVV